MTPLSEPGNDVTNPVSKTLSLDEAFNLALDLFQQSRLEEADSICLQLVGACPEHAEATQMRGVIAYQQGRIEEAEAHFRNAFALKADYYQACHLLSELLREKNHFDEALEYGLKAVALRDDFVEGHLNLARIYRGLGRMEASLSHYGKVAEYWPENAHVFAEWGFVLGEVGRPLEAIQVLRKGVELAPDDADLYSRLILTMELAPGVTIQEHQQARVGWVARFAPSFPQRRFTNDLDPERRLRVGYLSADFRTHSAAIAYGVIILHADRQRFELYCYNNQSGSGDVVTDRFRESGVIWRDVHALDDAALEQLIRQDGIDLLVDLSGHSQGNRMTLLARKPAPIQMSGWGYLTGTGMETVDYLLADPFIIPQEERSLFSETVLDLPVCIHNLPLEPYPEVDPIPPAQRNGYITFGCFNRMDKNHLGVMEMWARVLQAVPDSRIRFCMPVEHPGMAEEPFRQVMARMDIDPSRLMVRGRVPYYDHLDSFNQVDLLLDSFPHVGGVTSLEALRMGVPMISVKGATISARLNESFLSLVGLSDWIAEHESDYVEMACRRSADLGELARLRRELRSRFDQSLMGDHAAYTASVERVYRQVWQRYVASVSSVSSDSAVLL
ncbi:MAG: tetratricopeptide repeat protein [Magnetococcales bacterium]|nr:tetratricopeptide repeat protein [Magnetococcales bacterium]